MFNTDESKEKCKGDAALGDLRECDECKENKMCSTGLCLGNRCVLRNFESSRMCF